MNVMTPFPRTGLAAHEEAVRRDLDLLGLPAPNWPAVERGPDGRPVTDVLVIGAGMLGLAAAARLIFKGVRNVRVVDRAARGREGPWVTFARMETLRSPKHLTGAAQGIPSLTFRAWYEASSGREAWERLYKIPNAVWVAYLTWIRDVLELPVENGVAVERLDPGGGLVAVALRRGAARETLYARRVVVATGRGGAGGAQIPGVVDPALWPDRAAHSSEHIDFEALRGRRIAVLGAGASAWDNAATALEAGAARVDMYLRRTELPQINKGRGSAYPGFFVGWGDLSDAERWALTVWLEDLQAPPPHETVLRTLRAGRFHIHFGTPVRAARPGPDGVALRLGTGEDASADFLIVGTGFKVDLAQVPELAAVAPLVATWGDRYAPPADLVRPDLALYPYLGPGFELLEKTPGTAPDLSRIHLFNYGAHTSHRSLSGDVPGVDFGSEKLATRIASLLFREDLAHVRRGLEDFAEPELQATPFYTLER